jgi:hypothetical protein
MNVFGGKTTTTAPPPNPSSLHYKARCFDSVSVGWLVRRWASCLRRSTFQGSEPIRSLGVCGEQWILDVVARIYTHLTHRDGNGFDLFDVGYLGVADQNSMGPMLGALTGQYMGPYGPIQGQTMVKPKLIVIPCGW